MMSAMAKQEHGTIRYHRGGWEIRVQHNGRRVTRRVRGADDRAGRRAAEDAAEQLATELGAGALGLTVAELLLRYELAKSAGWSPSTQTSHRTHVAPLFESFGATEVARLRSADIEVAYGRWLAAGLSPATVRRRHSILAAALAQAVRWEVLAVSPMARVQLPAKRSASLEADPPSMAVAVAAVDRIEHRRIQVAARLSLASGMRRSELVALRWRDVDQEAGTIHIAGAVVEGLDGRLVRKGTKGGERRRPMGMDPSTMAMLRAWRGEVLADALRLGAGRPGRDAPVIPAPTDPAAPWHPRRISQTWRLHRSKVGLDGLRWHLLRHICATTLLEAGVPPEVVARRLGHSSTHMTLDVYGHATPAGDLAAVEVLTRTCG